DGDFIYYCKINNGRCQKICVGCHFNDKLLYDGDRYHKDNTVFMCEVRPDKYGHKPVGCVVRDESGDSVERIQTKTSKVEQTCVLENDKAVVKTLGCIYVHKGYDTLFIRPGTYTIWNQQVDGKAVGVICRVRFAFSQANFVTSSLSLILMTDCMKQANGENTPSLETFKMEDIALKTYGLKYDQPRG
ncbi:unnamed protein product, partial [Thelazia callipaeda]|uniref:ZP domain-containing protein n=1 Tax=Thelazia callipaeda TaxID=103827 RepID=A0A0N5CZU0_THECL